jgi:hypothetical protein
MNERPYIEIPLELFIEMISGLQAYGQEAVESTVRKANMFLRDFEKNQDPV